MPLLSEQERIVRMLKQTGKRVSIKRDIARAAILPGKRVSRYGNVYWETRKNRSDALGSMV